MKCLNCQKETKNAKFCSSSCSASFNNKLHPKRKFEHSCKICKKPVGADKVFCSKECKEQKKQIRINVRERTCKFCKITFPNTDEHFYRNNGGYLYNRCKSCFNVYSLERKREFKKKCMDYKGGKCITCSYSNYDGALEFHHLDPNKKEFVIGLSRNWNLTKKEMDKCILVCSNCHREIHGGLHPKYLVVKEQK